MGLQQCRFAFALLVAVSAGACQAQPAPAGTWAFNPKPDDFRKDALLDLRYLNEKVAGESGFMKVDAAGDFTTGDGKPLRIWAVNTGVGRDKPWAARPLGRKTEPDLARHARFLAKRGVNMVRLHAHVEPGPDQAIDDINEKERDWIWRTVAAMKKEGIYTTVSPYWAVPAKIGKTWGVPGGTDQSALGLLFFDPTLQKAYRVWLKKLLAEKNPYTGIPLAKDPALGIIQIQNEDSLLFWTFEGIKGPQRTQLETQYAKFIAKKYGKPGAPASWGGEKTEGDKDGRLGFLITWELTQARTGGRQARLADQLEFLTRTMHDFNAGVVKYLREELGCKHLVNAGNWRTADASRLNDAERWSYTSTEVDAVNRYYGGIHKGPNEGWAITNGDKFTSESVLLNPKPFPLNLKQTAGRPMMITESGWIMPNGYASEGPFLVAAYSGLTGFDAYYWFATGDDEWTPPESANGYLPSQAKWLFGNPDMLGTFPGAALMYRSGYIKRGSPVVSENRALADLWARNTPVISEIDGFDPNRDASDIAPTSSIKSGISSSAYLVGPVNVKFDADPKASKAIGLGPYVEEAARTAKSVTGELELNWDRNYCTVNTPHAQGVTAFFTRKGVFKLADVTFSGRNRYGAALAVSMDGKPLAESGKVLVQFGTSSRPTGWQERATEITLDGGAKAPGFEVVNFGSAPWQVDTAQLDVILNNANLTKATALDENGNAKASVPLDRSGGKAKFAFPKGTLYVVLTAP